jgi:hypothetical protein
MSPDADCSSSQQGVDTSTMDVDASFHYFSDDDNGDGDLDSSPNEGSFADVSNHVQPDYSLQNKYNAYLQSGLGQMLGSPYYQRDIELLRILMKAKAPNYLFDELKEHFRTSVYPGARILSG